MKLKSYLLKQLNQAEIHFDHWRLNRRIRKGKLGDIIIFPYRGYGNAQRLQIKGRVLEDRALAKPSIHDSTWTNFKAMVLRYLSREIPFVRLEASFQDQTKQLKADDEGYFQLELSFNESPSDDKLWHHVHFALLDLIKEDQEEIKGIGEVLIPDRKSSFGVISDIDDTILISNTTHSIKIVSMAMTNNASTRMPFHGVSEFYQALQKGADGDEHNPIFYVSSSPWNMYDLLEDFFAFNHIPKGPILLRDIGLSETKFIKEKHANHKLEKIRSILSFYPELSFILIGDSGQHDPEIYQQVVEEFPGRILTIYIRDVTSPSRREVVKSIASTLAAQGVELIIKEETTDAAFHAEKKGYIMQGKSEHIRRETKKDHKGL